MFPVMFLMIGLTSYVLCHESYSLGDSSFAEQMCIGHLTTAHCDITVVCRHSVVENYGIWFGTLPEILYSGSKRFFYTLSVLDNKRSV